MSTEDPDSESEPKHKLLLRLTALNLGIAGLTAAFALWSWRERGRTLDELDWVQTRAGSCNTRVIKAAEAPLLDPNELAPPQDPVRRDRTYQGAGGVDLTGLMTVRVEQVHKGSALRDTRFGSPDILHPGEIHVLNFWSEDCPPCRAEMPDFRDLFSRREQDWNRSVNFVAVKIIDHSEPVNAYEQWAPLFPARTTRLADRGQGDPVIRALRDDPRRKPLYYDQVPVTLVLDCNRRVRWAKYERLKSEDLTDLELHIDKLREELREEGPKARCARPWCGNGRCDPGEEHAPVCAADCDLRRTVEARPVRLDPTGVCEGESCEEKLQDSTADKGKSTTTCPAYCARCDSQGRCLTPKLDTGPTVATPAATTSPKGCGDGECVDGEDSDTCCRDCGCRTPQLRCTEMLTGEYRCTPQL